MNMKGYEQYGMIPVDYGTILTNLSDYKSPKDKVSKLEKSGDLIRLKKGLYLISPTLSKQALSIELIANHLYGPSYISYESALSFYGLIPERVYSVKSATSKRSKKYLTPIGNYEYITVPEHYFSIGLNAIYCLSAAQFNTALMSASSLRIVVFLTPASILVFL